MDGIALLGIGLELRAGEGAREVLQAAHEAEVEAGGHAAPEVPAAARVEALALLLAVLAVAGEAHDGGAAVEVEGPVDLAGGQVLLEEAVGAALAPVLEGAGVVAGLGHEVHGAADGVGAVAERVGPLEDLDALDVHQLDRLEVAEAVGLAVEEAVEEEVHVAVVEVVLEPRAPDGELALVGQAEARPHEHAGHEVQHVPEVGAQRLLDRRLADDLGAPGDGAPDLLARLLGGGRALGEEARALHDDRGQGGRGAGEEPGPAAPGRVAAAATHERWR